MPYKGTTSTVHYDNINHVKKEKHLSFHIMLYWLFFVVLQIPLFKAIFFIIWTVLPHGKDEGRTFASRQHKQTPRTVNVTEQGNSEQEEDSDRPRQDEELVH